MQDFEVERIFNHHSFKKPYGRFPHDISFLKLLRPGTQLNISVGLACLLGSRGQVSVGKTYWVTGYMINSTHSTSIGT